MLRLLVAAMLLPAVSGSEVVAASSECPCIDPFGLSGVDSGSGGGDLVSGPLQGANAPETPDSCAFKDGADPTAPSSTCYPRTYGTEYDSSLGTYVGACKAYDASLSACTVAEPPVWCARRWCWVDPLTCKRPWANSEYFPDARLGTSMYAPKLAFSYETCGNINEFSATSRCGEGHPFVSCNHLLIVHRLLTT